MSPWLHHRSASAPACALTEMHESLFLGVHLASQWERESQRKRVSESECECVSGEEVSKRGKNSR